MRLTIVRHGETAWNMEDRLQGQTDIPISRNGLHQAKLLAGKLKDSRIDIAYTSTLKRAVKTAENILKFHKGARLIKEKGLCEMSWGILEGLTKEDIRKKYPDLYLARENDKFNFRIPGGESPKILKDRIRKVLSRILKHNEGKNILVIGHGGVNRSMMGVLLGWSDEKILSVRIHNASITTLDIKEGKPRLVLFNSRRHLENGNVQG